MDIYAVYYGGIHMNICGGINHIQYLDSYMAVARHDI